MTAIANSPTQFLQTAQFEHTIETCSKVLILKMLFEYSQKYPNIYQNAYAFGCKYGRADLVATLISHPNVDPAFNDSRMFKMACELQHVAVVKILLQNEKIDPASEQNWALMIACARGHDEVVQTLLESKKIQDSLESDNPYLKVAVANKQLTTVNVLLSCNLLDPSVMSNAPLQAASQFGLTAIVQALATNPRVQNSPSFEDDLALAKHYATQFGKTDTLAFLNTVNVANIGL